MMWTTLPHNLSNGQSGGKRGNMEALVRKLGDAHDEIQRVRGEVVEALKSFYGGDSSLSVDEAIQIAAQWSKQAHHARVVHSTDASEIDRRISHLTESIQEVVGQLQLEDEHAGAGNSIITSFAQRERLKRQIEQSHRMLAVVEKVTHLDNLMYDFETRMDKGDIVGAAEACVGAQALFGALEKLKLETTGAAPSESSDIVCVLQLELLKRKNRLLQALNTAHSTFLSGKSGKLRIKKPEFRVHSGSPVSSNTQALQTLWQALDLMEELPSRLKDVVKSIRDHLLKSLFATSWTSIKISQEANSILVTLTTPNEASSPKHTEIDMIEQKCAQIITILRFFHSEILAGNSNLMNRASEFIWKAPGNLESHLLSLFQEKIPKDTSAVNSYRDVVARMIRDIGTSLESIGLSIPHWSSLRTFETQISVLYAKKRRHQILIGARSIMNREYRNSSTVSVATERCNIDASSGCGKKESGKGKSVPSSTGIEEVESGTFQLPEYRITHCTRDTVELVHQTLIEAVSSDPVSASTLYHTSRDILFLFRAVVPTLYEREIANDASTCMLFHNDCMYIAHHMLTIGHNYKHRFSSQLSQMITMVDMIPSYREAGESALVAFTKAFSEELRVGLKVFEEQGGVDSDTALSQLEHFVKSALYKLNQIAASWRDGLPLSVYNQMLKSAIEPFVSVFLGLLLTESTIGSSRAGKLHDLTSLMLETHSVFLSTAQAEKHVPALKKLHRLSALLVQPLTTIHDQYLHEELTDFSSHELSTFIRSLFRDSAERQNILQAIAARSADS